MTIIAPSILAADWGRLHDEVQRVAQSGADWLHLDVMDGQFVPPITFGPGVVAAVRKATSLPLDVHLMIRDPERQIAPFRDAGADLITVHYEVSAHLHRTIQSIHESGARAGVSINPSTPVSLLAPVCADIDLILIMSVNPGWGGQKFIPSSVSRVGEAAELIRAAGRKVHLEVDGGINQETAKLVTDAGADVLVAGTFIFGKRDYREPIAQLRA